MNRTLIGALDGVNNLLAIVIIVIGTGMGFSGFQANGGPGIIGAAIGLVAGIIAASVVCGLLAILIEMEKHLRQLAATSPASNNVTTTSNKS